MRRDQQDVFKSPDHLTEKRKNREAQNPEQESQDIAELKKIIKNKNDDNSTRLLRAKMVTTRNFFNLRAGDLEFWTECTALICLLLNDVIS